MIELIKSRLEELYREREHLNDPNRYWLGNDRRELLKMNQIRIGELENLLKHTDVIRNDKIDLILY
jgi:hypothetical protein